MMMSSRIMTLTPWVSGLLPPSQTLWTVLDLAWGGSLDCCFSLLSCIYSTAFSVVVLVGVGCFSPLAGSFASRALDNVMNFCASACIMKLIGEIFPTLFII